MKFPGRFGRLMRALSGTPPPPSYYEQLMQREAAKQEQQTLAERTAYAERLRPLVGRLLLVTDFGSSKQEEHADRVAQAVLSRGVFADGMPTGISAHIVASRPVEASSWPAAAAMKLMYKLRAGGLSVPGVNILNIKDEQTEWLASITRAAENTAEQAGMPLSQVGHIAVVGVVGHGIVDIRDTFGLPYGNDSGVVYQLNGLGDQAIFDWLLLSADMGL